MVIPAMGPADDSPFRYDRGRRGGASTPSANSAEAEAVSPREPPLPRGRPDRTRRPLGGPRTPPAVLFIVLLVGIPLALAIYLAFTDASSGSLGGNWVGLQN